MGRVSRQNVNGDIAIAPSQDGNQKGQKGINDVGFVKVGNHTEIAIGGGKEQRQEGCRGKERLVHDKGRRRGSSGFGNYHSRRGERYGWKNHGCCK